MSNLAQWGDEFYSFPKFLCRAQVVRRICHLRPDIHSSSMLSAAFVAGLLSSFTAIANGADASCGVQYSTMNTVGDVVGTILYPASPEVCCANCTANPDCQFFVTDDGGWRHIEPKCLLMSKAQTMNDYLHGSYSKNTIVISGREIPAWGKCGDRSGFKLCTQGFYCQPWDSNYYQCIEKPKTCEVYTNVDLYGNDIKRIQGIKPGECCDECDKTMGCVGYTYVNDDTRGTQCYLKNSVDGWTKKIGVHSGTMPNLPAWSKCGDYSGFRPCIDSFYCQPWDRSYYQCIERPRCSVETNIDYYGNDIKRVTGSGGECCEECGKTPGCDSYTYINDDPSGTQCYLKSSNAGRTTKIGAVSGIVMPAMSSIGT